MISYPLLKQSIRSNFKLFLTFIVLLTTYIFMIIGMYDPQISEKMKELLSLIPGEVLSAFGFDMIDRSLTGYLASYMFGFLLLVFPMIYTIIVANRLIASGVEKGTMVYLIATPNSRGMIAYTQAFFLVCSIGALFAYVAGISVVACEWMFPGMLRTTTFIDLCLGAFALHFAIGGISYLSSCCASSVNHSLIYGAGIPMVFYFIHMIANLGGKMEVCRYATIFTLFDTEKILSSDIMGYVNMGVLVFVGIIYFAIGILVFRKRDLSI